MKYKNGNYYVKIESNGSKVRFLKDQSIITLVPDFPESIDIKITNYCDAGCVMCHENSTKLGEHGDVLHRFLKTLRKGTEIAIGGGNPLDHPELIPFLKRMKKQGVISNMTVNQMHFMKHLDRIDYLLNNKLVKGLGVSLNAAKQESFYEELKKRENVVLHVINGILRPDEYEYIKGHGLKILILGYKTFGRGELYMEKQSSYIKRNMDFLYNQISKMSNDFKIVSFDNLAIRQLDMRRFFTSKEWSTRYMGDDGEFTMYVDLVKGHYARSSFSAERYDLINNIDDMFAHVRNLKLKEVSDGK